jgi:hypothetical protein
MSFCTANTLFGSILASEPEAIVLAYSTPREDLQSLGSGLRISSDDFDSVGELYLEDDFWQLRPNFHKKRRLRSVIEFKRGVPFRHVVLLFIRGKGNYSFQRKFFGGHFRCDHQKLEIASLVTLFLQML